MLLQLRRINKAEGLTDLAFNKSVRLATIAILCNRTNIN